MQTKTWVLRDFLEKRKMFCHTETHLQKSYGWLIQTFLNNKNINVQSLQLTINLLE